MYLYKAAWANFDYIFLPIQVGFIRKEKKKIHLHPFVPFIATDIENEYVARVNLFCVCDGRTFANSFPCVCTDLPLQRETGVSLKNRVHHQYISYVYNSWTNKIVFSFSPFSANQFNKNCQ